MNLSLRSRLVAKVVVVTFLVLCLAGACAIVLLRSYLTDRVDERLHSVQALLERAEVAVAGQGPPITSAPAEKSAEEQALRDFFGEYVIEYRDPDGEVMVELTGSLHSGTGPELPLLTEDEIRARDGTPFEVDARGDGDTNYRVLVRALPDNEGSATVAYSMDGVEATLHRLLGIEVALALIGLTLVGLLSIFGVRIGLRPLLTVESTAEEIIAGGDLSRRVPHRAGSRTEIGRLSGTLNTMLDQIEQAFRHRAESEERLRRFSADASHELRTPLASIRGLAELYRQGAVTDPAEVGRLMGRIEAEATRLGVLVDDLLLLARLDQERPFAREPVDLLVVAADAVHDARALDPERPVALTVLPEDVASGEDCSPVVLGDESRLRQVTANLLGNALTHTPSGTPVDVRVGPVVENGGPAVVLEVVDHGPGLTEEQGRQVFERFYRADPARSRRVNGASHGGSGLGLSIVAAIATAHGGTASYQATPGGGATFRIALPPGD